MFAIDPNKELHSVCKGPKYPTRVGVIGNRSFGLWQIPYIGSGFLALACRE